MNTRDNLKNNPLNTLADRLEDDFRNAVRSGFVIRGIFGTAIDRFRGALRTGMDGDKAAIRAAHAFLGFLEGAMWFVLYSVGLIISVGGADIASHDYGDEQADE